MLTSEHGHPAYGIPWIPRSTLQVMDTDGSGTIDRDEFVQYHLKKCPPVECAP